VADTSRKLLNGPGNLFPEDDETLPLPHLLKPSNAMNSASIDVAAGSRQRLALPDVQIVSIRLARVTFVTCEQRLVRCCS
jgi:hypothetical protein